MQANVPNAPAIAVVNCDAVAKTSKTFILQPQLWVQNL
jgi:hypothetical protein